MLTPGVLVAAVEVIQRRNPNLSLHSVGQGCSEQFGFLGEVYLNRSDRRS